MPPNLGVSDAAIVAAVRAGELDEARARPGRRPGAAPGRSRGRRAAPSAAPAFDADAHHALARAAAPECAVLLKNDDALLPLQPAAGDTIAVIGEFARTPRYQGAGSSQVNPTRVDVALDELRARRPGRRRGGLRRRLRHRRRRTPTRRWPPRPWRWRARAGTVVVVPRPARRRRVRGLRPRPHRPAGEPDRAGGRGSPRPTRGWSSCWPTAPRCGCRRGSTTPPRCSSAGCPGRPRAAPSPTCCSGRRNPSGRLAETLPAAARRTRRRTSTSPARPVTCATARASSSATAATTRSAAT